MNVFITGISGYLGQRLAQRAAESCRVSGCYYDHMPNLPDPIQRVRVDIRDACAVMDAISTAAPQTVIHTAALNSGNDEGMHQKINALGSANVARAAETIGARLIHVSTDLVHDGYSAPYGDNDTPNPLNAYGRSKAQAEVWVRQNHSAATIVRTSLIYDFQIMPRSTHWLATAIENNQTVSLFNDVIRQPIALDALVSALLRIARLNCSGFLNVVGRQAVTREYYERKLMDYWNVNPQDRLKSVSAAGTHPSVPLDLRLSINKAESVLGQVIPGFDEMFAGAGTLSENRSRRGSNVSDP